MEKHEHVITLSTGTKDRADRFIRFYKSKIETDILEKLLKVEGIDTATYTKELKSIYSTLNGGRTL